MQEKKRREAALEAATIQTFVRIKIKQVLRDNTIYRIVQVKKITNPQKITESKQDSEENEEESENNYESDKDSENLLILPKKESL